MTDFLMRIFDYLITTISDEKYLNCNYYCKGSGN